MSLFFRDEIRYIIEKLLQHIYTWQKTLNNEFFFFQVSSSSKRVEFLQRSEASAAAGGMGGRVSSKPKIQNIFQKKIIKIGVSSGREPREPEP